MSYFILTPESLTTYVKNNAALWQYFDKQAFTVQEIGDGNLNLIFLLTAGAEPQQQLIIKQALPYLRCVGADFPLSKTRIYYEIAALKQFANHTPKHIPKIYHIDEEMCLFAMQYFGAHQIMRQGMIAGLFYPQFTDHLSTFLAENLFKTSSIYLNSTEKGRLIAQFNQNELRQLTEDLVFTCPYMEHATNKIRPSMRSIAENLWRDFEFKHQVLTLKDLFMNKTDALLHGDLHTGSILINAEETIVIDPEFAYMGPFGFDLGAIIANLIMSWISHMLLYPTDPQYANEILATIQELWCLFEQKFLALWHQNPDNALVKNGFFSEIELMRYQQQFMRHILQETIGFAGCKIARRQWGVAGVADIRGIQNETLAIRAETLAISIARLLVIHHRHYDNIHDIFKVLYAQHTQPDAITATPS